MTADQFCDRCGTRVSTTAAFCGSCGRPVARAAQPPAWTAPEPPPAPAAWHQEPPPVQAPYPPAQQYAGQYAAPAAPPAMGYQGAPGYEAPRGAVPARPGFQMPPLGQLATQADIIAIAGGVLFALAIVLPVYGGSNPFDGFTLLSTSVWTIIEPLLLAVGAIGVGVLVRQRQIGAQVAIGAIVALGAVGTAQFGGYLLDGLIRGGLSSWGIGSLLGAVGGVVVLVAGLALARQHPLR
jgi:hypothetical protein